MKTYILLMMCCFAGLSVAGQLNPPTAPTTGTMKTLDEVEPRTPIPGSVTAASPYTISESGSYYLTGNRMASTHGILIEADNVTLDLNGFALYADTNGTVFYGIHMSARKNVTIKNGTIRGFGYGVSENYAAGHGHRLIDLRVSDCTSTGIGIQGDSHQILRCTATNNGSSGIWMPSHGSMVKDCVVSGNSGHGISGFYTALNIVGNTVFGNTLKGIYVYEACVIKDNITYNNGEEGIYASHGSVVKNNTSHGNGADGIRAFSASVIGNSAYANQEYGIYVAYACLVDQNMAHNNNQSGGSFSDMIYSSSSTYGTNQPTLNQ